MDRQIIYPGAIPLETDLLNTNKYSMMGLAKLASAIMGENTYLRGLQCTASSPASMVVNISSGEIYSLQNVDGTAYSSLDADTAHLILKQGMILDSTQFSLTAPTVAGQSVNYLIQVAYSDIDSGATVLPYYNAANPSVAYSGPNNNGETQNTVRSGVCRVAIKAGVSAVTGTQTTPSADAGFTAAWVITLAQGASSVTADNISTAVSAPFIPIGGLVSAIQQGSMTYADDIGAANAYAAFFVPALPTLVDGMRLTFKANTANTAVSTFSANGGTPYPIYSQLHQALQGGEIIANGLIDIEWNSALTAWVLCGNSGGALPVVAGTKSNHAVNLGQFVSSKSGTGYRKLPDGTIKMWGVCITSLISSGNDASWTMALPTAFPNYMLTAQATLAMGAATAGTTITVMDVGTPFTGTVDNMLPKAAANSISGHLFNNSGSATKFVIRWECEGY